MVEKPTFEKLGEGTEKAGGTKSEDSGFEMAYRHYKRFYEAMEGIDEAIQSADRVDRMLDNVMETVLQIFECDRAWLFHPCNPDADSFRVTVESTTEAFPGAKALGKAVPMTADMADYCRRALAVPGEVVLDPPEGREMENDIAIQFDVQSLMLMALYPRVGETWMFGLHQCGYRRNWRQADRRLFRRIGFRITDALSSRLYLQQLEESEKRYRHLFETALDAIYLVSLDTLEIKDCNPKAVEMDGYTFEEMAGGMTLTQIHPTEEGDKLARIISTIREEGSVESVGGLHHFTKAGRWVPIELNGKFITFPEGEFALFHVRDVSERMKTEQALRESEENARALLNASTESAFLLKPDGTVLTLNEVTAQRLKKQTKDILGQCIYDFVPGPVAESRKKRIEEVLRTGRPVRFEDERWGDIIDQTLYPVMDGDGNVVRIAVFGRDVTDSRRSEQALRESEKEFRMLIENIVDWVWKVDVNGCYTYVSPQMESIMGYPTSEVLGKTPFDFMRLEEAERVRSMYAKALADRDRIERMEDTLLARDGREVVFETNATPIFDEEGNFQGYMGTCRDITERKRSEAALRASEERFDLAMRFANDGLFDWNLETNEIYYSPVWKRILGYEDHEIENEFSEWERLTKADDVESSWAMMREVMAGRKGRFEIEFQMRHKEGHWVDIFARANVVRDDRGKPVRVLGTHVDVTQRKRAERDLEKVKEQLEALWSITKIADADIKSISDHVLAEVEKMTASKHAFYGFLTEDEKTMVLHAWSPKTMDDCRVTGKPVHFPIDKAGIWADAVRQRRTVILNDYRSDRQGKKDLPEGHVDLTRFMVVPVVSNDKVLSVAAVANKQEAYTEADEKQVRGFLANVQILLDRKQAEKEKLELMERLQHVQRMEAIGTLAGGVAHDFNNILSPILVQTELAKLNLPQDHAVQENLDEVLKAGHRAADLVKHILTFSRQEKQKHVIFDMRGTVKEVLKLIRATIPSSIEIVQRISAEPATIMGDPTGIHEVLMNLCSNAAQAMDEMGSVLQVELREVELDREFVKELPGVSPGAFVRLSVSDTGHGIPREVIGRIFDPYFTTKEVGKGTGMGLAVAHGVVREHGGAITVYSEPGQGTTFHVLFPKVQGEVIEAAGASKGIQTGTERILFVDDEEAIIRSGSQMLELLGYEVRSTTVPVEALEMFRAEPNEFDLVITDMTMPHMTGEVLAREMMDIRPDIPIILCTGFSYRIDEQKAKDIGIKGWIMKPFIMRETADMIRNVLGG